MGTTASSDKKFKKGLNLSPTDPQHVNGQFPPTDPEGRTSMDFAVASSASASSRRSVEQRRRSKDKGGRKSGGPSAEGSPGSPSSSSRASAKESLMDVDEEVSFRPAVFRWPYGGQQVYVTGTFNDWKAKIPLNKSGDDFIAIIEVTDEAHQYKFIVDDEWRTDPTAPSAVDEHGNINNFLDIMDGQRFDETGPAAGSPGSDEEYGCEEVEFEENRKNPAMIPPHLQYTPLNHGYKRRIHDPLLLPVPHHVTLNHTYYSVEDSVMALGLTHRCQGKFSTVILYKPVEPRGGPESPVVESMVL